jgi:hypothetical protein
MPYVVHHISRSLSFSPELLSAMGEAFDCSMESFTQLPGADVREAVASQIVALAERGLADPASLCRQAVIAYRRLELRCGPGASALVPQI